MNEIHWHSDRAAWETEADVAETIAFGAFAPPGKGIWAPRGGRWECSAGVVFGCLRCIGIIHRGYDPRFDYGFEASLEGSTRHREHTVGPGSPLRATLLREANAVGLWVFTVCPNGEPVLVRASTSKAVHERVVVTFDPPTPTFVGLICDEPLEWVELALAPDAVNDYVCMADFSYGSTKP